MNDVRITYTATLGKEGAARFKRNLEELTLSAHCTLKIETCDFDAHMVAIITSKDAEGDRQLKDSFENGTLHSLGWDQVFSPLPN